MARCPLELLDDLTDVFGELLTWPGVVAQHRGVFYAHRQPFLHFHLVEGGRRRADVKTRSGWVQLDLPHPISATRRRAFLRELRARYRARPTARGR